jgi:hypothetical protein
VDELGDGLAEGGVGGMERTRDIVDVLMKPVPVI